MAWGFRRVASSVSDPIGEPDMCPPSDVIGIGRKGDMGGERQRSNHCSLYVAAPSLHLCRWVGRDNPALLCLRIWGAEIGDDGVVTVTRPVMPQNGQDSTLRRMNRKQTSNFTGSEAGELGPQWVESTCSAQGIAKPNCAVLEKPPAAGQNSCAEVLG